MRLSVLFVQFFIVIVCLSAHGQNVGSEEQGWFPKPMDTINELFDLYEWGASELEKKYPEIEYKKWLELINKKEVQFTHPTLGKIKYTLIDGEPIIRLVHARTGTAFLFLDSTKINKNSEHLQQYVARVNMFSGVNDHEMQKNSQQGRDAVLIWFQPEVMAPVVAETDIISPFDRGPVADELINQTYRIDYHPKPTTKMGKIRKWWQGIYKRPNRDAVAFGVACGVLQTVMGLSVSAMKVYFDPSAPFLIEPAVLNFIFGVTIGIFSSTYRNWVYETSPSMFQSTMRGSAVSLSYSYSLTYMTQGGWSALSIMDTAGLLTNAHLISNMLMNNYSKTESTYWAKVKSLARTDNEEYNVKIPLVEKPFKVKQRDINYQILSYLPPQALRTADLIGISLSLPLLGWPLPLGSMLFWGSTPIVKYATLKWAEKNYPEEARALKLRESWEDFKRFPITVPVKVFKQTLKLIDFSTGKVKELFSRNEIVPMKVSQEEIDASEWKSFLEQLKPEDIGGRSRPQCSKIFLVPSMGM